MLTKNARMFISILSIFLSCKIFCNIAEKIFFNLSELLKSDLEKKFLFEILKEQVGLEMFDELFLIKLCVNCLITLIIL
jgi:hypothetical protein